ncbi:unnamed protein product [Orchesella dallaii]|uniref:Uncharacterized protein n=1 Tax=Orchesella dallaii TaxID=48710 RepID=A0ABP1Q6V6_9HEXA
MALFKLFVVSLIGIISASDPPDIHVTMGVTIERVPGAVMYESSVPFLYNVPSIDYVPDAPFKCDRLCQDKVDPPTRMEHKDENGDSLTTGQRGCALSHSVFEILQTNRELLKELESADTSKPKRERYDRDVGENREKRNALIEPLGDLLEIITGVPSSSTFRQVTAHVNYIDQFMQRITKLTKDQETRFFRFAKAFSKTTSQTQQGFKLVQEEMRNITWAYNNLQKRYDDTDLALLNTNIILADAMQLQHGLLTYLWLERSRDQCLQKKIPRLLVSPEQLETHLGEVRQDINTRGFRMSIPEYEIELYYKVNVMDCVWERRKGLMRLQIPVVPQDSNWLLYRIQSIPYAYHNRTCYINIPSTLVAVNGDKVIPYEQHDQKDCVVANDFLCRIPRYGMKISRQYVCITKIMRGTSIEDLQQVCEVSCHMETEPSVTLIAPREYIITNLGENRGLIHCPNKDIPLEGPKIGGIAVRIPCNCQLLIDSKRLDHDAFPCIRPYIKETSVNHTLPIMFTTKFPRIRVAANKPVPLPIEKNISKIMDVGIDLFEVKKGEPDTFQQLEEALQEPIWFEKQFDTGHTLVYVWLALLTGVSVYTLILYRPMTPPLTTIAMTGLIPRAEAKRAGEVAHCNFPVHLEVLMWIYLAWTVVITFPYAVAFIRRQIQQHKLRKHLTMRMSNTTNSMWTGNTDRRMQEAECSIIPTSTRQQQHRLNEPEATILNQQISMPQTHL